MTSAGLANTNVREGSGCEVEGRGGRDGHLLHDHHDELLLWIQGTRQAHANESRREKMNAHRPGVASERDQLLVIKHRPIRPEARWLRKR